MTIPFRTARPLDCSSRTYRGLYGGWIFTRLGGVYVCCPRGPSRKMTCLHYLFLTSLSVRLRTTPTYEKYDFII